MLLVLNVRIRVEEVAYYVAEVVCIGDMNQTTALTLRDADPELRYEFRCS